MKEHIKKYFNLSAVSFKKLSQDESVIQATTDAADVIIKAFKSGRKVLICGNGGSSTDAMHFAEEMTGKFRNERAALPVISLTDPSHITCVGNDYGFEYIFSRGVEAYGEKGDVLIGISTSGNSENVIRAIQKAKKIDISTIGLSANTGGELAKQCDISILVKAELTDMIQALHITILHLLIELVERELFPANYTE